MKNIFLIAFGFLVFQISTAQGASNTQFMNQPWKMHHIDRQFWNHNSLSPGDVNKDGLVDYLVIHEGADKVTILFNPGIGNQLYHEWEKVVISDGNNIEYGYFGDLNGDGGFGYYCKL